MARENRDDLWSLLRRAFIDLVPAEGRTPEDLANDYEPSVRHADELADLLYAEADRVARYSQLQARLVKNAEKRESLDLEARALDTQEEDLGQRWRAAWQPSEISPLSCPEMRSWVGRYERLTTTVRALGEAEHKQSELEADVRRMRALVAGSLDQLGEPGEALEETLLGLIARASSVVAELDESARKRVGIAEEIRKAQEDQAVLENRRGDWADEMQRWRVEWQEATGLLGLDPSVTPKQVEAIVARREELFEKFDAAARDRQRIEGMEREGKDFADFVGGLVHECAPDLRDLAAEEAARRLIERFNEGRIAQQRQTSIDTRLEEISKQSRTLESQRVLAEATLSNLVQKAGCGKAEDLAAVEVKVSRFRELESRRNAIDGQLRAERSAVDELLAEAQAVDPDILPGEIAVRSQRIAEMDNGLAAAQERVGGLRRELAAMDGSDEAAQAATQAEEALSTIVRLANDYGIVKLAQLILDREIERFQQENQGPLLRRAGEMFQTITNQAYVGLISSFDADDRQVLMCRRADGQDVGIDGLSEGTRDQLYLALRLAYLDQHLSQGESLPLVIDDVLVNFDDKRARAALRLLGQLAEKTQVLFFTHHSRLVELAREAIPGELLEEHDLDLFGARSI